METKQIKGYMPHIDMLKGIAILLMVMGHAIAWSFNDYSFFTQQLPTLSPEFANATILWKIIYSFHMPLLFLVSGFLFYKGEKYDRLMLKVQLRRRFIRIFIPYLTTGSLLYLYKGVYGYWFLQVIFILDVIVLLEYYLLDRFEIHKPAIVAVSHCIVFLLLHAISKLNVTYDIIFTKQLVNAYVPFIVGISLKEFSQIGSVIKHPIFLLLSIVFYLILFIAKCNIGFEFPLGLVLSQAMSVSICLWLYSIVQNQTQSVNIFKFMGGVKY